MHAYLHPMHTHTLVYIGTWISDKSFALTTYWSQIQFLSCVLRCVLEQNTPSHFALRCLWQLNRGTQCTYSGMSDLLKSVRKSDVPAFHHYNQIIYAGRSTKPENPYVVFNESVHNKDTKAPLTAHIWPKWESNTRYKIHTDIHA